MRLHQSTFTMKKKCLKQLKNFPPKKNSFNEMCLFLNLNRRCKFSGLVFSSFIFYLLRKSMFFVILFSNILNTENIAYRFAFLHKLILLVGSSFLTAPMTFHSKYCFPKSINKNELPPMFTSQRTNFSRNQNKSESRNSPRDN